MTAVRRYFFLFLLCFCGSEWSAAPSPLAIWPFDSDLYGFDEFWYQSTSAWTSCANVNQCDSVEFGNGSLSLSFPSDSERETDADNETCWSILLNTEKGYGIEIFLQDLVVDPEEDYLLITPGITPNDSSPIQLVTGNLSTPLAFMIPNSEGFFVKLKTSNNKDERHFNLTYQRSGSRLATPIPPTSGPDLPAETAREWEIYLSGKTLSEYMQNNTFIQSLKEAIRATAKDYCSRKEIPFEDGKETDKMIYLFRPGACPYEYPNHETCVILRHAVFVSGDEEKDYELKASHLQDMWQNCGNCAHLASINLSIYPIPDVTDTVLWWVIAVVIVLLVMIIGLVIFWKFKEYLQSNTDEALVEDNHEFDGVELRRKITGLKPSKHQTIPNFMSSNNEVTLRPKNNKPVTPKPIIKIVKPGHIQIPPADSPASSDQFSPVTPAVSFGGALHFNYNEGFASSFEEDEVSSVRDPGSPSQPKKTQ